MPNRGLTWNVPLEAGGMMVCEEVIAMDVGAVRVKSENSPQLSGVN